jgi:chorismate-pyruvate lyase
MAHSDSSIRHLIRKATSKTRTEIEREVWNALSPKIQEQLGHAQLRRMIAAELSDPSQFEFLLEGEPFPIEDIDIPMLRERGYRLIKGGKKLIERGEAYLAEAKRRENLQRKTP